MIDQTIDHAAEARKHLADVEAYENDAHSFRFNDEDGRAIQALSHAGISAQSAQVHATLALVEQQRVANLVALYTNPSAEVATAMEASGVSFSALIRQIKEGMGLS